MNTRPSRKSKALYVVLGLLLIASSGTALADGRWGHDRDDYHEHHSQVWHRPAGHWLVWRDRFGVLHREFQPWHHGWRSAERGFHHRDEREWPYRRDGVTIIYRGWF